MKKLYEENNERKIYQSARPSGHSHARDSVSIVDGCDPFSIQLEEHTTPHRLAGHGREYHPLL